MRVARLRDVDSSRLTAEDVELVRVSLRSVTQGAQKLTAPEPRNGSLAARVMLTELNDGLPVAAQGPAALFSARIAADAAIEGATDFVDSIQRGRRSVSLAPTVRAVLEAASKAHYLLSANDERDLLVRHQMLAIEELQYPVKHSQFQMVDGREIDGEEHRAELERALDQLRGKTAVQFPKMTERVSNLLGVLSDAQPVIYSQLSGTAHAATSALGMFLDVSTLSFVLPRVIATEYAAYVFAAIVVAADDHVGAFGVDGVEYERWESSRRRGYVAMKTFRGDED